MSLPEGRADPDEVFEMYAENTPEEVMALADTPDEQPADEVDDTDFERFVAGVETNPARARPPTGTDDPAGVDIERLFE